MSDTTYERRRGELEEYFDRTAVEAWARMTTDAPLGRIRATVRAGREEMRATLGGMLPDQLNGHRVLDAGCGTGLLASDLARRGAEVVGVDLSENLIELARSRTPEELQGSVLYLAGDMLDTSLGEFDHAVAMDSLIHYPAHEIVRILSTLAHRTRQTIAFTFAPRTPALAVMHAAGRLFPRSDRAPAIEPAREATLRELIDAEPALEGWAIEATRRIQRGFYTSQAVSLRRTTPMRSRSALN